MSEVADFMRGLSFFPTEYEAECLRNELQSRGRRKVPFESLVKLYINHSHSSGAQNNSLEISLRNLLDSSRATSTSSHIHKSDLVAILTESAEKIDEKDAESFLKEIFCEKLVNEIPLSDFVHRVTSDGKACIS